MSGTRRYPLVGQVEPGPRAVATFRLLLLRPSDIAMWPLVLALLCPQPTRLSSLRETLVVVPGQDLARQEVVLTYHDVTGEPVGRLTMYVHVGYAEMFLHPKYREDLRLQEQLLVRAMREIKQAGGTKIWESGVMDTSVRTDLYPRYDLVFGGGKFAYKTEAYTYSMDIPDHLESLLSVLKQYFFIVVRRLYQRPAINTATPPTTHAAFCMAPSLLPLRIVPWLTVQLAQPPQLTTLRRCAPR